MNNQVFRRIGKSKMLIALVAALLVICMAVGGTVAFLTHSTGPLVNTFVPGEAETVIAENNTDNVKKDVKIQNTNNSIPVYIRARVVVNWADAAGNVLAEIPADNQDYEITWYNEDVDNSIPDNWQNINGVYYYQGAVAPGGETTVLFTDCSPKNEGLQGGYKLQVTILSDAIQADGTTSDGKTAVEQAWGYKFANGTWTQAGSGS